MEGESHAKDATACNPLQVGLTNTLEHLFGCGRAVEQNFDVSLTFEQETRGKLLALHGLKCKRAVFGGYLDSE